MEELMGIGIDTRKLISNRFPFTNSGTKKHEDKPEVFGRGDPGIASYL